MKALIDTTYFLGELKLLNVSNFDILLTKYQEELLSNILGLTTYLQLDSDMQGVEVKDLPEKWKRIISGCTYTTTVNGKITTNRWGGLSNNNKESIIANYFYYKVANTVPINASSSAITIIKGNENSDNVDTSILSNRAFNDMLPIIGNYSDNTAPSFYNMMVHFIVDYPDWEFLQFSKYENLVQW